MGRDRPGSDLLDGVRARLRSLWLGLRRGRVVDSDMADEFRFHIERRAADLMAEGEGGADAVRRARKEFGSIERYREEGRAARGLGVVDELRADTRYAARGLVRNPAYAVAAVLTLALAIGANTAIFSVVDAVLLRPLPFPDPERLITASRIGPDESAAGMVAASHADYTLWQRESRTLAEVAAYTMRRFTVTGASEPVHADALAVDPNLLSTLGVQPRLGRDLPAEARLHGGPRAVLLTHGFWRRGFGSDPGVVGRSVMLNGTSYEITGVLPAGFEFPPATRGADGWRAWRPDLFVGLGSISPDEVANYPYYVIGRLRDGATIDQARQELEALSAAAAATGAGAPSAAGAQVHARTLHNAVAGPLRPALLAFVAAVALVLLIACANLSSLMFARLSARHQELGVRMMLGAGRARVARQLMTESLVLALFGGVAALGVAWVGLQLLIAVAPTDLPGVRDAVLNSRVLVFTLVASVMAALVFGMLPVLQAGRYTFARVGSARTRGGTSGPGTRRVHSTLVAAEVALATALLVGAGLLLRSFDRLVSVDPGFSVERLITLELSTPVDQYPDLDAVLRFFGDVETRLGALAGVAAVSGIDRLPFGQSSSRLRLTLADRPELTGADAPAALNATARPGYFETMGIRVHEGRTFTRRDVIDAVPVVLVSRSVAQRYWPDGGAVGARVRVFGQDREIAGVVGDVRHAGPGAAPEPMVYFPHAQDVVTRRSITVVVRTTVEPAALLERVRAVVREVDAQVPVTRLQTFGSLRASKVAAERFNALLIAVFGTVALAMAAVGIFGVMSFTVARRTREIGVRMALGASAGAVLSHVVRQAMVPVAAGVALGVLLAVPGTRLLQGLLFDVGPFDPLSFAATAATLTMVGLAAAWLPARRAARVNPIAALRQE